MHSSRIRTVRALTIGGVPTRGVYLPRWGVYLPGGLPAGSVCTCLGGVPAGGVPAQGGTCSGVYLPGGVYLSRYHQPVNRMTDRCKTITLPQTSFAGGNDQHAHIHTHTLTNLFVGQLLDGRLVDYGTPGTTR